MKSVIRVMENPPSRLLPSQRAKGVVEELDWGLDPDGVHIRLMQTLWTRNRRTRDERGEVVDQTVLLRLSAHDAVRLLGSQAQAMIFIDVNKEAQ